jgi:hypothetical protein
MWREEKVRVAVVGTDAAPHPPSVVTLREVVRRWPPIKRAIAGYVRGLAPDHHVPLDPPTRGGFAARSCCFDEELCFESLSVGEDGVRVTFYTGYPDGYATFEVTLDDFEPTAISAFAS